MVARANFQQSVFFPQTANPGDFYGTPEFNAGVGALSDPNGAGIVIGTFCWGLPSTNNTQVTQLPASGLPLAGFVARVQNNVWADADVSQGYSYTIPATNDMEFFPKGSFFAVAASLNGGGTILAGDIIIQNNTTGVLASQTSTTVPSGYTQIVGWTVINPSPLSSTTVALANAANLVVISNVTTF